MACLVSDSEKEARGAEPARSRLPLRTASQASQAGGGQSQGTRNSLQAPQWGEVQEMSQGHQRQAWRPAQSFFSPSAQH